MHAHLSANHLPTQLAVQSRSEAHSTLSVLGVVLSRSWPLFTAPDNPLARGAPPSQHREALRGMMVAFQHLAPKVDPALLGTLHHLQQHPDGGLQLLMRAVSPSPVAGAPAPQHKREQGGAQRKRGGGQRKKAVPLAVLRSPLRGAPVEEGRTGAGCRRRKRSSFPVQDLWEKEAGLEVDQELDDLLREDDEGDAAERPLSQRSEVSSSGAAHRPPVGVMRRRVVRLCCFLRSCVVKAALSLSVHVFYFVLS